MDIHIFLETVGSGFMSLLIIYMLVHFDIFINIASVWKSQKTKISIVNNKKSKHSRFVREINNQGIIDHYDRMISILEDNLEELSKNVDNIGSQQYNMTEYELGKYHILREEIHSIEYVITCSSCGVQNKVSLWIPKDGVLCTTCRAISLGESRR